MTKAGPFTRMVVFGIEEELWLPSWPILDRRSSGSSIALVLLCIQVAQRCVVIFDAIITRVG